MRPIEPRVTSRRASRGRARRRPRVSPPGVAAWTRTDERLGYSMRPSPVGTAARHGVRSERPAVEGSPEQPRKV